MADHETEHEAYASPFSWRYGSEAMRALWSERHKRRLWRQIWLALAEAQQSSGLVSEAHVADLRAHVDDVNMGQAHQIEAEIMHDLMAELRTYASQCPVGGAILHLGATSMDVEDNAEVLRIRAGLDLILTDLGSLLQALAAQVDRCLLYTSPSPRDRS